MPSARVGACHPGRLALTGDRAERSRLTVGEWRPRAEAGSDRGIRTRHVGALPLVDPKIATQVRSGRARSAVLVSGRSRFDRVGVIPDLTHSCRHALAVEYQAADISRRGGKLLRVVVGVGGYRTESTGNGATTPTAAPSAESMISFGRWSVVV